MILLIVIGLVSLIAIIGTVVAVARDGYRPVPTDRSRVPLRSDAAPSPDAPAPAPASAAGAASFQVQRGWS
jgi:hypothetical protein